MARGDAYPGAGSPNLHRRPARHRGRRRPVGGVEIVNVCLRKPDLNGYERVSLDRLLNRINTSVAGEGRHAFLIVVGVPVVGGGPTATAPAAT